MALELLRSPGGETDLHLRIHAAHLLSELDHFQIRKPFLEEQHLRRFGFHQGHCLSATARLSHLPTEGGQGGDDAAFRIDVGPGDDCGPYRGRMVVDRQNARRLHRLPCYS